AGVGTFFLISLWGLRLASSGSERGRDELAARVPLYSIPAFVLGHVEGLVRFFKECSKTLWPLAAHTGNAKTHSDLKGTGGMSESQRLDRSTQPLCYYAGILESGLKQQDRKLLSPVTGNEIIAATVLEQGLAHLFEHLVAIRVAVPIVHLFEVVNVAKHQGQRVVIAVSAEPLFLCALLEVPAVVREGEGRLALRIRQYIW